MNITNITQRLTILPEVVRDTFTYAVWNYGIVLARLTGTDPDLEGGAMDDHSECTDGHCVHNTPYAPWESGRKALEFMMLVRNRDEFGEEAFGEAMDAAMPDLDSPQHAVDVVLALAFMANELADDNDVAAFAQLFLHAEASAS